MTGLVVGVIAVLLALIWIITVADIVRRRLGRGPTAAWLCIVLLLPFLGALLYWTLRKPTPEEVERQARGESELRRTPPKPYDRGGL